MKSRIGILCLLFLMNTNYGYGQDSGLALKVTHTGLNDLQFKCELKNVSNDTIEIDYFCVNSNGFRVEKPNGKIDGIGLIACGGKQKSLNVYPEASMTWNIDLESRYFNTSFWGIRPRKNGTYKFYWTVNGIKSNAFVYEYFRKE